MEEKTKSKGYVLRKLFFACLYLSTFTFGGGYVIVTLLKEKFVDHYHWIEEDEMLDLVAIAQSSPGAIAVNGAIIVGYKLAGIPGMLVSVIGAIIPPMVILSVISVFYDAFCSNYYIAALLKGMTLAAAELRDATAAQREKSIEMLRIKRAELQAQFEELSSSITNHTVVGQGRIIKAFPKMQHRDYSELIQELKKRLK